MWDMSRLFGSQDIGGNKLLISQERFERIYRENKVMVTCLVLIINNDCNADCIACIAHHVFKSPLCKEICERYTPKCIRCCDHTASDEEFYAAVEKILQTINSPFVDIIITGGEPTISPRLIPTLEIIDKYDYSSKTLEMETNGANLADASIVEALKKRNVLIHLSRYGITDEENMAEFRYKYGAIGAADIRKFAGLYGDLLGVSTVLLNNHISSAEDLLKTIDYHESLGVRHHAFLEVMADVTLRTANKELLEYYDMHRIAIAELSKRLEELGCPKVQEQGDESYHVFTHEYKGKQFTMTSSNLEKQHRQETGNGFSRFLIMPSGEIGVNGIERR
mgnify:CR=1 FL=1